MWQYQQWGNCSLTGHHFHCFESLLPSFLTQEIVRPMTVLGESNEKKCMIETAVIPLLLTTFFFQN